MNACRLFRRFQPGLPPTSTPPPQRPRLVSEQVLYQHPPHTPIRIEPCLAAAAPRSTSRASATAPARATSPTNSNGTFPEPRPSRPPSSLSPSICIHLPPSQPLPRCSCAAPASRGDVPSSAPVACSHRPPPSLALSARSPGEALSDNLQAMVASSAATSRPRARHPADCKSTPGSRMRQALTAQVRLCRVREQARC
jgi:hypothetical protein